MTVTFDDSATASPLNPNTANCSFTGGGYAPAFVGSYQPIQALSSFDGEAATGVWHLDVSDAAGFENGSLNEICITIDVPRPNLTTSTLTVTDLNGGQVNRGDTLQYDLTLNNTGDLAASATITADIASHLTNFLVTNAAGGTDNSLPFGGSNGNGYLDISAISVAIGGSQTLSWTVEVNNIAPDGTDIQQSALVNDGYSSFTLYSGEVTVSDVPQPPATGNKAIYFLNGTELSRLQSAVGGGNVNIEDGREVVWRLREASTGTLKFTSGNVPVTLWIDNTGNQQSTGRLMQVELYVNNGGAGDVLFGQTSFTTNNANGWVEYSITVPNTLGEISLVPGSEVAIKIANTATGNQNVRMDTLRSAGNYSKFDLPLSTLIRVEALDFYDAAYPASNKKNFYLPGETVFIRADVSDPFGSFDINGTNLTVTDALSNPILTNQAMTQMAENTTAGTKVYEWSYTVPVSPNIGSWQTQVTALEGLEGTIDDSSTSYFYVGDDTDMEITKTVDNATPVQTTQVQYTVRLRNLGPADATNISVADLLPTGVSHVSSTPSAGSYDSGTGAWTIANLAAGQSATLFITVTADQTGVITNTATFQSHDQTETNNGNDSDDAVITVLGPAQLSITRNVNPTTANQGDTVTHQIRVENVGQFQAQNIQLQEDLTQFLALVLDSSAPFVYDGSEAIQCITGCSVGVLELGSPVFSNTRTPADPFSYLPSDQGGGIDGNVAHWRLPITGQLAPGAFFEVEYQARVK